jgi:hypothetical protein
MSIVHIRDNIHIRDNTNFRKPHISGIIIMCSHASYNFPISLSTAHAHVNPLVTTIGNGTGPHSIPYTTNLAVECSFGGVPILSQRWYRDGTIISLEGGVELGSGERKGSTELVLQEPVSGVYQCHVGNQYGSLISTTAICVHNVPGPTPFSVIADSTTSLYVTWSPPQPPSIHPLLLRYEILTTHTLTNLTFSSGTLLPSSSPWVVKGLNASSEYRVRVKSWSPLGQGADGQKQTAYTYGPGESSPSKESSTLLQKYLGANGNQTLCALHTNVLVHPCVHACGGDCGQQNAPKQGFLGNVGHALPLVCRVLPGELLQPCKFVMAQVLAWHAQPCLCRVDMHAPAHPMSRPLRRVWCSALRVLKP